ncbi:MAG: hydrogenase small subunit [Mobiluncus porci]|uniref:hydrogenase small subunit n=1 Tax=Mobiluncus TaxID=2050 RepID=UPI0023F2535A|nr:MULTISPECIES: hydrogenase small subunit [Mobiluncus]MCI6584199.1 hydrogenase small subunit [Mobiluncus sp.]MDD7541887.1 hydrogenase small subunit [Mobiluncus porci]MDY5749357.1 hydrogenase small subunit [Mobiluncus porci]
MTYNVEPWTQGTLAENIAKAGVSRRDFMKFCSGLAAIFAVGTPAMANAASLKPSAEQIAKALGEVKKPLVVWLQLQECTGCMESVLRSGGTTVEEVVLNLLSVNYNELVMAAAGEAAEKALEDANNQDHILVVNGSVPLKDDGIYCTIGGKSAKQILEDSAKNASMILAVGACAVFGSVQAAKPNPTGAVGVDEIIKDKPVINVSGCPPIGEVITATLAYILTHGKAPEVDAEGRPLFAYGQRIHDSCPRRPHYDAGQYVRTFDDAGAREGWCLYDVGCKGPSTFSPCPIVQWNLKSGWPIGAGHPCIGCTERDFYDRFTPFYQTLPSAPGFGVESTTEKIGLGLTGVVAAGVAVHAGITAAQKAADRRATKNSPMAAFGDTAPGAKKPEPATETTEKSEA